VTAFVARTLRQKVGSGDDIFTLPLAAVMLVTEARGTDESNSPKRVSGARRCNLVMITMKLKDTWEIWDYE
jgi:hypothetical protein